MIDSTDPKCLCQRLHNLGPAAENCLWGFRPNKTQTSGLSNRDLLNNKGTDQPYAQASQPLCCFCATEVVFPCEGRFLSSV